ncbi:cupin domain-containing protein [Chitinilyticum aquatile]|uniref:cupin domain-containing protein n=1 Tax=Chitinilyticum aquatile TaxID=362520 RepID=UPI00041A2E96|nr:cupin domain-containing protein [Chitinilyticum aquatile]
MQRGNLFRHAGTPSDGERFDLLLAQRNLLIERIVSSPRIAATTYVQEQDEWVVLLQGEAVLDVTGELVPLAAGDYLFLPAGTPHTVCRVSDGALWLAVHLHPEGHRPATANQSVTG